MAREEQTIWGCDHHYPIVVLSMASGRRARCLGCGARGPVREEPEEAMLALRDQARYGDKLGA